MCELAVKKLPKSKIIVIPLPTLFTPGHTKRSTTVYVYGTHLLKHMYVLLPEQRATKAITIKIMPQCSTIFFS